MFCTRKQVIFWEYITYIITRTRFEAQEIRLDALGQGYITTYIVLAKCVVFGFKFQNSALLKSGGVSITDTWIEPPLNNSFYSQWE